MAPTTSAASKRIGKENAPPVRNVKPLRGKANVDEEDGDELGFSGEESMTMADPKPVVTRTKSDAGKSSGTQRKLDAVTAERDRLQAKCQAIQKQFEDLSKLRTSDSEALFEKYKEKTAVQAQAQNDIISNLSALNDKLQDKIKRLEKALTESREVPSTHAESSKAGAAATSGEVDHKELKVLKEQLGQARASLQRKEERLSSLDKDYKAEQEHSKSLQAELQSVKSGSKAKLSQSVSTTPDEAEKDAQCLRLYEDLSEIAIVNVKVEQVKGQREVVFNCIMTRGKNTLNFKLRSYHHLDQDLARSKSENPWQKRIRYHPEHLDKEVDREFVDGLGVFAQEFTIPRDDLPSMYMEMRQRFTMDE